MKTKMSPALSGDSDLMQYIEDQRHQLAAPLGPFLTHEDAIREALRDYGHTDVTFEKDYSFFFCGVAVKVGGTKRAIRFEPTKNPPLQAIIEMLGPYGDSRMG